MSETALVPQSQTPSPEGFITVPDWTEAPKTPDTGQEAHEALVADSTPKLGEQSMKAAGVVSPEDFDIDKQKLNVTLPNVTSEAFPRFERPKEVAPREPSLPDDIDDVRLKGITTIIAQPTEPPKKKHFWQ